MKLVNSLHPRFKKAINSFIRNLSKNLKSRFEVYIFGSLAGGDCLIDSDVVLIIVVTDELKDLRFWERTAYLRSLAPENVGFDIICYTFDEFEGAKYAWQDEIKLLISKK